MGACPYCRSTALPGDTICYSCGRVLPKGDRSSYRMEQQFSRGSKDKTYKMSKKPTPKGIVQTHTGRKRNIMKRRKNRFRSVIMLSLVAFIMLSPQAREHVLGEFGGIDEFLQSAMAEYHVYPVEASYTLSKISDVQNNDGQGYIVETIMIPPVVKSTLSGTPQFLYENGEESDNPVTLQETELITLNVAGQSVNVPVDGLPSRSFENRIVTSAGHEIWWPDIGSDNNECPVNKCVKVKVNLEPNEASRYSFDVQIRSTSYSWWDDARVKSVIPGKSTGVNVENSGTFEDLASRGNGVRQAEFGGSEWYNRGSQSNPYWAINGQDGIVMSTADLIATSLPEGKSNNVYAFSRAAFDYLHLNVVYDRDAPVTSRSGPECLAGQLGDCDDQTNAFFSLLRTRGIPGWYTFGILGDPYFSNDGWEAHAWGYFQLPMKDSWCEARNIILQTCFVEAQVDVVNNKWLLSTPTAYVDWIEDADASGNLVYDYYHPVSTLGQIERVRSFETVGDLDLSGGSYQVKKYVESLD